MKALLIKGYGNIKENLTFSEIERPTIKDNQVLIEVHAASVNPIDYKIIEGIFKRARKLTFPASIGFDVAGIVVKKGDFVLHLNVGDEVYSRVPTESPGTFAQYIAVNSTVVVKKPSNLNFKEASSIPLVGLTTVQCFEAANLKPGSRVMIYAGSGGIGTFAIQYAKAIGAFVYTTTSTENVTWVKALGADRVIDYKKENFLNIVENLDIVFDTLGGNYTTDAFKVIKKGGTVVSIAGELDSLTAKKLGLNRFVRFILSIKRKKITKLSKEKSALYKFILMQPNETQLNDIKRLIENGLIKTVIDKVYPFSQAIDALLYQKTGRAKGKIIIDMEK